MKKTNAVTLIFASAGMLVLILDGKTAVLGIQNGLEICLRSLIPSLFPFFILSGIITGTLMGHTAGIFSPLGKLCGVPEGSESLIVVGILGGYPIGASNLQEAYQRKQLRKEDAVRMAVFCNNAGPSFIFGVLGQLFQDLRWAFMLWLAQIVSALITGYLLPGGSRSKTALTAKENIPFQDVLYGAMKSMAVVCGWVILFRMVLEFLNRWFLWVLPNEAQVLITGILELANGCIRLQEIQHDSVRFLFASMMLSLGGICVWMQTKSVFPDLDTKRYLVGKALQSGLCLIISLAMVLIQTNTLTMVQIAVPAVLLVLILTFAAGKRKKAVAIQ